MMFLDSMINRLLLSNLSRSCIVRVDLRCLNRFIWFNSIRNYSTQSVTHSTDTPFPKCTNLEPSSIYVNPECMQMDRLMHNCTNHEDLLNILVTHRGSMYLHNLITVMKLLKGFVENDLEESNNKYKPDCDDLYMGYNKVFRKKSVYPEYKINNKPLTKTHKELIDKAQSEYISKFQDPKNQEYLKVYNHNRELRDIIIRDERYDLLLQDLYVNKNKLDVISICNVIITLDTLGHKYYRLYNGLLKRLLTLDISFLHQNPSFVNNVGILLLKTCQCYSRSGFYDIPLYNKVCNELFRTNLLNHDKVCDIENQQLLSHIIRLYSMIKSYDYPVFNKISEIIDKVRLTPSDLSWLALTYSNHHNFNKIHDKVLYHVANRIKKDSELFSLKELSTCILSFSKMRLYFKDCWNICTNRLINEIAISMNGFDDIPLNVKELCKIVHDLVVIDNTSNLSNKLIDKVSQYLEERIDSVDEESCINLAVSMLAIHSTSNNKPYYTNSYNNEHVSNRSNESQIENNDYYNKYNKDYKYKDMVITGVDNTSNLNNYLMSFVWRRIGTDVSWEREPLKVFAIWLYHMLVLPHFNHNIHKRCILPCFRQWLLVYNTRYEIKEYVCKVIRNLSKKIKIYTKSDELEKYKTLMDSPVPIDFIIVDQRYGNKVINITENTVRNETNKPMGVELLIKGILEHFGLEIHFIDLHLWMKLDDKERTKLIETMITNVDC